MAIPRELVSSDHLFSNKKASTARQEVEAKLGLKCRPLTVGQHCANWFLLKWLLSGTNAGIIYSKSKRMLPSISEGRNNSNASSEDDNSESDSSTVPNNITYDLLASLFEKCMESWFD